MDGYNVVHADPELKALAESDMAAAREELIGMILEYGFLVDYQIEVVFDAAGSPGPARSEKRADFLSVVYTSEGSTADSYIEGLAYSSNRGEGEFEMVVTGDYIQQRIAIGAGMLRKPPREFLEELRGLLKESRADGKRAGARRRRVTLEDGLSEEVREKLGRMKDE